jgi:hypothetical protein
MLAHVVKLIQKIILLCQPPAINSINTPPFFIIQIPHTHSVLVDDCLDEVLREGPQIGVVGDHVLVLLTHSFLGVYS